MRAGCGDRAPMRGHEIGIGREQPAGRVPFFESIINTANIINNQIYAGSVSGNPPEAAAHGTGLEEVDETGQTPTRPGAETFAQLSPQILRFTF
jgi:hypothetical protein